MSSFRPILNRLRRAALRGVSAPTLFTRYRDARDEDAMAELVLRSAPRLRALCRPYLQDRDEVDEVVQEVFRLLVERADTIRDANGIDSWLDQTAVNVARNRSRRQALRTPRPMAPDDLAAADPGPGPELIVELREKYAHVLAEIDRLNADWKRALQLKLLEDRPYAEVAELLGASLDKVKQDVSRARKQLRWRLAKKGIVLPAALAGVLLGGAARGRAPMLGLAVLAAAILIGAVIVVVRAPTNPEQPTNPIVQAPTAPVVLPDPPRADDVVLGKVVSILDGLTGMKTKRTQIVEDGPRRVRWRLAWTRDPEADPNESRGFGKLLTEKSYMDLVFDRWSGKLDMEVAFDGKKANNIDPLRPIIIGPPSFEIVIKVPELIEIHQAFPMMLLRDIPPAERSGPLGPERIHAIVRAANNTGLARPEPDQGIAIRLEPGATISATRQPGPQGKRTVILFWRTATSAQIGEIHPGGSPWTYRNESTEPQDIFIAAICGKSDRYWMTCQPKMTLRDDGLRVLEFDEDYQGQFEDARVDVKLNAAE